MKRWLIATGLIALAAAACFAALPLLVSTDIARDRIASVLSKGLGATVSVGGEPHLMLFPRLRVSLPDVHAENEQLQLSMDVESVETELNIGALLGGQIEPTHFVLRQPEISAPLATIDRYAQSQIGGSPDQLAAPLLVTMKDGAFLVTQANGIRQHFTDVDATLDWPGGQGAATLSGQFRWRGEDVDIRGQLSDTAALTEDGKGSLNLAVASTALRVNFEGVLARLSGLQADGTLSVAIPNLRRTLGWIGLDPGEGATLGAFALNGTARVDERGLVLSPVTTELDGNTADGALTLAWHKPRPSIKGTLASEKLDISGYISELTLAGKTVDAEALALPVAALSAADVDMQLSARQIRIGETRVGQTAMSLLIQDGNMAMEVGEAVLYGGSLTARLSANTADVDQSLEVAGGTPVQVHVETKARGLNIGALPYGTWAVRPTEGTADLTLTASASAATLGGLLSGLEGDFAITAAAPVLNGFDLANMIEAFSSGDARKGSGVTTFSEAVLAGKIANGALEFSEVSASGPTAQAKATGRASFVDFTVALSGDATHQNAATGTETTLPFLVRGPLSAPQFLPDLNRLIDAGQPGLAN